MLSYFYNPGLLIPSPCNTHGDGFIIHAHVKKNVMAPQQRSGDMPRERDDETGRYRETYPAEAFVEALETLGDRVATTELRDEVGCSHRIALDRLKELTDEDTVDRQKVGNVYLWSLKEDSDR